MKKRISLGVITLVLIITLLIPVQAQAESQAPEAVSHFTAQAGVFVTDPGVLSDPVQTGFIIHQHQNNEKIEGTIISCEGWEEIEGAYVAITHSADSVINLKLGTFTATASGTIEMYLQDGSPITATYHATLSGKFYITDQGQFGYDDVQDFAQWKLISGAAGTGTSLVMLNFIPDLGTYGGIMTLSGTHR